MSLNTASQQATSLKAVSAKWLPAAALLLASCSVAANSAKSLSTEQFLKEQMTADCGYWVERQVEVCDERTVYVDEPYKQCNYNRTYTTSPAIFPASYSSSIAVNQSCQPYLTHGVPGYTPHANYSLSSEQILTRQVARTERYNCRLETRWVWVPGRKDGYCELQQGLPHTDALQ